MDVAEHVFADRHSSASMRLAGRRSLPRERESERAKLRTDAAQVRTARLVRVANSIDSDRRLPIDFPAFLNRTDPCGRDHRHLCRTQT